MNADTRRRPAEPRQSGGNRFDEADWLDWDHWQTVEEIQDLVDGLSSSAADQESDATQSSDDKDWAARLSRQLRRQGLELDN